jgi:hypothetical protein
MIRRHHRRAQQQQTATHSTTISLTENVVPRQDEGIRLFRICLDNCEGHIFGVEVVQVVLPREIGCGLEDSRPNPFDGQNGGMILGKDLSPILLQKLLVVLHHRNIRSHYCVWENDMAGRRNEDNEGLQDKY